VPVDVQFLSAFVHGLPNQERTLCSLLKTNAALLESAQYVLANDFHLGPVCKDVPVAVGMRGFDCSLRAHHARLIMAVETSWFAARERSPTLAKASIETNSSL